MRLPAPFYQDEAVTIYHGRCEDVMQALNLSDVSMVLADPPYGIGIQSRDGAGSIGSRTALKRGIGNYKPALFPSVIDGDGEPFHLPVQIASLFGNTSVALWGANHYSDCLPRSAGWLVWDKREKGGDNNFADAELAWTNFCSPVRVFRHYWNGMLRDSERGPRLHPMQKPVALMKWVLSLAKLEPGSLVLDPYTGSGPVLRAAKDMGLRAIGIDSLEWCCERAAERCRQNALPLEVA
jgi:DNA modification methylase